VVRIKGKKYNISIIIASIVMCIIIFCTSTHVLNIFSVNQMIFKILFGLFTLATIGGATASEVNYIRYLSDEAELPPEFQDTIKEIKDNENIDIV